MKELCVYIYIYNQSIICIAYKKKKKINHMYIYIQKLKVLHRNHQTRPYVMALLGDYN